MSYKGAFDCEHCPKSNAEYFFDNPDQRGCPQWWEFMTTNINDGKQELKKMCGYQALPRFLTEVIAASNRPAAAIESMRNEQIHSSEQSRQTIQDGLQRLGTVLQQRPKPLL